MGTLGNSRRAAWQMALVFGAALALVACEDDGPGAAGTSAGEGGSAGEAGEGGSAGEAGEGGSAGAAGMSGEGGSAGTAGEGGSAGEAGEGGSAGEAGEGGSAGTAGEGGEGGSAGTAGEGGSAGTAGEGGTAGDAGEGGSAGTAGEGGTAGDAGTGGTAGDAGTGGTAGSEPEATPAVFQLSTSGHDRLYGMTFDADGNIYATGQIANDITSSADFSFLLVKFTPDGQLDMTFGNDGVVVKNVAVGGTSRELARGVIVQDSGKIVIAGTVEHDVFAPGVEKNDTDIALVRFNADGSIDSGFGTAGVVTLDLNDGIITNPLVMGVPTATLTGGDSQWSLDQDNDGNLIVHGTTRADGFKAGTSDPRTDGDWALVRLTVDGVLDTTFSTDGIFTLDIAEGGASARTPTVLDDGSIIGVGYTSTNVLFGGTGSTTAQQPVLYKVTPAGELDDTFATTDYYDEQDGVWHDFATPGVAPRNAEAYGAALQGDHMVTIGYGPGSQVNGTTDWVSFRFTLDGDQDLTYGVDGAAYIESPYGDNGRYVLVLPDNRVMAFGAGRPTPLVEPAMLNQIPADAMIGVFTEDGVPDTTFGPGGFNFYNVGGAADHFWQAAVSPDATFVAIVGIAGAATTANDDNSVLFLLPLDE